MDEILPLAGPRPWKRLTVALSALTGLSVSAAGGQTILSDAPWCPCPIQVDHLVTLSDPHGDGGLSRPLAFLPLASGGFLLVADIAQGRVQHYDETGRFVGPVGGRGRGPREFMAVLQLAYVAKDTIAALDPGNNRIALIDSGLRVVSTARLPAPAGRFAPLPDRDLVLVRALPPPGQTTPRVIRWDRHGDASTTLVDSAPYSRAEGPAAARRWVASSQDGEIAILHHLEYRVDLVRDDLIRSLRGPRRAPEVAGALPPGHTIEGGAFDRQGRLWIVQHSRESPEPSPGIRPAPGIALGSPTAGVGNERWDSVLEVIDPAQGLVIGRTSLDARLLLIGDGWAVSYREDEMGNPYVDVWAISVGGVEPSRADTGTTR